MFFFFFFFKQKTAYEMLRSLVGSEMCIRDRSGKVSRAEWIDRYGSANGFSLYDLNHDGVVDPDEFRKMKSAEFDFEAADTNADTKISKEEWVDRYGSDKGFEQYDLNHDGGVDQDEFRVVKAAEFEFEEMDTNQDGKISKGEWIARYGTDQGFDLYDLDGNGIVDPAEFIAVKAQEYQLEAIQQPAANASLIQILLAGEMTRQNWCELFGAPTGFGEYDKDEDGVIGLGELDAAKQAELEFYRGAQEEAPTQISRQEWFSRYNTMNGYAEYAEHGDVVSQTEFESCRKNEMEFGLEKTSQPSNQLPFGPIVSAPEDVNLRRELMAGSRVKSRPGSGPRSFTPADAQEMALLMRCHLNVLPRRMGYGLQATTEEKYSFVTLALDTIRTGVVAVTVHDRKNAARLLYNFVELNDEHKRISGECGAVQVLARVVWDPSSSVALRGQCGSALYSLCIDKQLQEQVSAAMKITQAELEECYGNTPKAIWKKINAKFVPNKDMFLSHLEEGRSKYDSEVCGLIVADK
eukprot:TRINITY_DN54671_c0_g1_i1.p1 TRINITY_DN54671_c0_g1~~TRINITY_DN54671_c0_g1_i1.p1  ORF type:complete len:522 (-),score=170.66 TRINITY_DN54671_c0_g1_i1:247-1812(-)